MRFTVKLIVGYALFSVLTLAMGAVLLVSFQRYQRANHLVYLLDQQRGDERSLQVALLTELQAVEDYLTRPDPASAARASAGAARSGQMLERILRAEQELARTLSGHPYTQQRLRSLDRLRRDLRFYELAFAEIRRILNGPPPPDGRRAAFIARTMKDSVNARVAEIDRNREAAVGQLQTMALRQRDRAVLLLFALVGGSLAASLAFTVVVATSVRRLLRRLSRATRRVAAGDYDHPIVPGGDPELNELYGQFNAMAEQLKTLEQMRLDFVSMLSHDLKSPLAVIRMYADTLATRGVGEREVAAISRSADRLLRLVENFLDFSRAENARLVPSLRPVELAPLLERLREDGGILAKSYEVTVEAEADAGLPPVLADEALLERALHNLVSNGVKFNRPRGRVTLRALRRGRRVRFEVADTGLGISEADQRRLFEKYFRGERTRHISGTGLGLAATREIVRAHHGELQVESREGGGTVFSFELPAAPGA